MRGVRLGIGIGVRVVFGRGITIGVAKIQRFGIGARVKVGRGITIGVAKIQSQLFSHTQTQPINTTIKKKN